MTDKEFFRIRYGPHIDDYRSINNHLEAARYSPADLARFIRGMFDTATENSSLSIEGWIKDIRSPARNGYSGFIRRGIALAYGGPGVRGCGE